MKVAILGFGIQGRSAYRYWRDGNEVTVCDRHRLKDLPPEARAVTGDDYLKNLDRFDLIVRSPIIHPSDIVAANSSAILPRVTSVTNEFMRVSPSSNIIGVTGTKGKGTTSTLIAKILEAAGYRVHIGGNIGIPPLDLLDDDIKASDWVVLELANFQLIDLSRSPHIGVCLGVVPEHLDWHADHEEYVESKGRLFRQQTAEDIAIYYADSPAAKRIASSGRGRTVPYMEPPGAIVSNDEILIDGHRICLASELKLLGRHNWQNACAAVTAAWQITKDTKAIRSALTNFTGLPFRIEYRREVKGVKYYNDSFASGPGAAIAAFRAVTMPKVMIIGGFDRGLKLDQLAETFARQPDQLRKVLLIGAAAQRTAEAFKRHGFTNYRISAAKDMATIVNEAAAIARAGDAVVLSPAFASFDMFKNFEDRGNQFNTAVEAL